MNRNIVNYILLILLLSLCIGTCVTQQEIANKPSSILFEDKNMIDIPTWKIITATGKNISYFINTQKDSLKDFNITAEEISHVTGTEEDIEMLVLKSGRQIELQQHDYEIIYFTNVKGQNVFTMAKQGFLAQTMDKLIGDKTLVPMPHPSLAPLIDAPLCNLSSIQMAVKNLSVYLNVNEETSLSAHLDISSKINQYLWKGQGLLLLLLNPSNCQITFREVFQTDEAAVYRDLLWLLASARPGRLALLATLRDGSMHLQTARMQLKTLGSMWSKIYLFLDSWINAFIIGGKTLGESITPNLSQNNYSSSPVKFDINLPFTENAIEERCPYWPTDQIWETRRTFCSLRDGFGKLCSCAQPFQFNEEPKNFNKSTSTAIPIVVLAGNRTRHLYRLLESLGHQKDVHEGLVQISVDDIQEDTLRLLDIMGLHPIIHRPEGQLATALIARHLRFALYNALQNFPKADAFIVLEDDLILSKDFYSYMRQLKPIFDLDPTIYCVNAFNHLSFPHSSSNNSQVYRTFTYPAYGWMVSRQFLEFMVPKFLPDNVDQDWDYFIGSDLVRGDRECLVPDINRSFHWSTHGIHVGADDTAEKLYLSRGLQKEENVTLVDVKSLTTDAYEREMETLFEKAIQITFDKLENITLPHPSKDKVFVVYVAMKSKNDDTMFRLLGNALGIWNVDNRDTHNYCWRLYYQNATLLVVGAPYSKYIKYISNRHKVLKDTYPDNSTLKMALQFSMMEILYFTHYNHNMLPSFANTYFHVPVTWYSIFTSSNNVKQTTSTSGTTTALVPNFTDSNSNDSYVSMFQNHLSTEQPFLTQLDSFNSTAVNNEVTTQNTLLVSVNILDPTNVTYQIKNSSP